MSNAPERRIERHLYKRCLCENPAKCRHPWNAQYRDVRISLARWARQRPRTITEARTALEALKQAIDTGTFSKHGQGISISAATPLRDLVKRHCEWVTSRGHRTDYRSYARLFVQEWGDESLLRLARRPYQIEERLEKIAEERRWTGATFNQYRAYGRALFNKAKKWGYIDQNPFDNIPKRREAGHRRRRISPEQEAALIAACNGLGPARQKTLTFEDAVRIRAGRSEGLTASDLASQFNVSKPTVYLVLGNKIWHPDQCEKKRRAKMMRGRLYAAFDLGLRRGEMLAVQLRDVNFEKWVLHLPAAKTKSQVDQEVLIETKRLRDFFLVRRCELEPQHFVFGTERGGRIRNFRHSWHHIFRLAGLPVGPAGYVWHDIRHEFGSYLVDVGASIQEAQEMLRHRDPKSTARYLAASEKRMRRLAATFQQRHREVGSDLSNEGEAHDSGQPPSASGCTETLA
jgi:integrase